MFVVLKETVMNNRSDRYQSICIDHTQADIILKDGTRPYIAMAIDQPTRRITGIAILKSADKESIAAFRKSVLSQPTDPKIRSRVRQKRRFPGK
jgi:hypothetical protein